MTHFWPPTVVLIFACVFSFFLSQLLSLTLFITCLGFFFISNIAALFPFFISVGSFSSFALLARLSCQLVCPLFSVNNFVYCIK